MKVFTALGEMDIESTGLILSHEHILWFYDQPPTNEREAVFQAMYDHYIPMYREIVEKYGCDTLIEHSPDFIDLEIKKVGVSQKQIEIMMKLNPRKLMMRG